MQQQQQRRRPQSRPIPDYLAVRRLRLISDIMEDYQENMRRTIRLLEMELVFANDLQEDQANERVHNASEWVRGQTDSYTNNNHNAYTSNRFSYNQFPRYDPFRNFFRHNGGGGRQPPAATGRFRRFDFSDSDRNHGGYTNEEIDQVAETMPYIGPEFRCPITWDTIVPGQEVTRLRGCGHAFNAAGIREWFQRNRRCPVCRAYPTRVTPPPSQEDEYGLSAASMAAVNPSTPGLNAYTFSATMLLEDPSGFQFAEITPSIRESIAPPSSPADPSSPASSSRHSTSETMESSSSIPHSPTQRNHPSSNRNAPMNTLLEGIVGVLSEAITDNGGAFEREFTFNISDLLGSANIQGLNRTSR